jgi:microcin C transport system permease protein
MINWSPETKKRWRRFKAMRRGYVSFWLFIFCIFFALVAELFINNRALLVRYEGQTYLPIYGAVIPGSTFGLDYQYETNYRDLKRHFAEKNNPNNFVILPIVPYNAFETHAKEGLYPPFAPSIAERHFFGTDTIGRDVLARLVYGFRIAILFSLLLLIFTYGTGVLVGTAMGYYGGWFDLLLQRLIEVWTNIPFLYVVIIISSLVIPGFLLLVGIIAIFDWTGITWYVRTLTYKEKARDYVASARAIGASSLRIMTIHILPNAISIIVTFVPFAVSAGITQLTALDFLGFGLPAPTPSWGDLIAQGMANLGAYWIISSVTAAMVIILTMVTFMGEGVREAFDPKKYTIYE